MKFWKNVTNYRTNCDQLERRKTLNKFVKSMG